jgi:anti-sigma regulatory factor (Ser/Thr protein kinase)/GNAT superfamily N-acetyltransferase
MNEKQIARLTLATDPRFLRAAALFVKEAAVASGLAERAAVNLELATEEAGLLIIDQSFHGQTSGTFDIVCEYQDGRFIAAFEDKGAPFEWGKAAQSDSSRHSVALLSGFADELHMVNRGKAGKRLEFVIRQSSEWLESSFRDGTGEEDGDAVPMAPLDTPIELRAADPVRDGVAFARCMHAVYGYSYVEAVYFPERVKSLIEQGLLMSFVAVTQNGEVVGHQGVKLDSAGARVANSCMGAVDPRFRGRRLFEQLKEMAVATLRAQGLLGVHSEAVSLHPFSQRANIKAGGRETGMLLAHVPRGFEFKSMKNGAALGDERQTAVLYYNPINPHPHRSVHLPLHHRDMIERIYAHAGIDRSTAAFEPTAVEAMADEAEIDLDVTPAYGMATIAVRRPGRDLAVRVRAQLEELIYGKIDVIYLDIGLASAATPHLVPELEALGFSFCGVYPEKHRDGDLLRLHYLNQQRIDPSVIVTASDMGKLLLDYALAEAKRVRRATA